MNPITWHDFEKVEMRVGTILEAVVFSEAKKPAYKLKIDFGNGDIRRSSAQITLRYKPEELVGRQIIAVTNFPPKQIGPFVSECLVLGAVPTSTDVVLLSPDFNLENGTRIA